MFPSIARPKFKQWLPTLSSDLLDLSGYVIFSFTSAADLAIADSDKDSQALTLFRRSDDRKTYECQLLVAGKDVPCANCDTALKLAFSYDGVGFQILTEEEGEPWKPSRCMHVSTPLAGMLFLDLLGTTWGPKLRSIPYVAAGMQLRAQLGGRVPADDSAIPFDDICAWLDRFQIDVNQKGYFSRSLDEFSERQRKYIRPERRTTREALEAQERRSFPMNENKLAQGKSVDIPAFRFKPLQDGIKIIVIIAYHMLFLFVKRFRSNVIASNVHNLNPLSES